MTSLEAPVRLPYQLYRQMWSMLDWVFPPQCAACGARGWRWCPQCVERAQKLPLGAAVGETANTIICACCGAPERAPGLCVRCKEQPPQYTALRAWAVFTSPVREAVHKLKYRRDIGLGDALACHLVDLLTRLAWEIDVIAPVPLSAKRIAERGYNQAALLARPLALAHGISYEPHLVRRVRHTASQVGLNMQERQQNVQDAFEADDRCVQGLQVLLVDDVVTTGATLNACAQALRKAGAQAVYALAFARASDLAMHR